MVKYGSDTTCNTLDFRWGKPESLYLCDSLRISGYCLQISWQKVITTIHHITQILVHNLLHAHNGVQHYKPLGWIRVKFYAAVASISEGTPSFILLAHRHPWAKRCIPQSYRPSALLSKSDSYPTHPKSIPKEWDRSTSPTVCNFKWPNF
jgi:hypothetical protein